MPLNSGNPNDRYRYGSQDGGSGMHGRLATALHGGASERALCRWH